MLIIVITVHVACKVRIAIGSNAFCHCIMCDDSKYPVPYAQRVSVCVCVCVVYGFMIPVCYYSKMCEHLCIHVIPGRSNSQLWDPFPTGSAYSLYVVLCRGIHFHTSRNFHDCHIVCYSYYQIHVNVY